MGVVEGAKWGLGGKEGEGEGGQEVAYLQSDVVSVVKLHLAQLKSKLHLLASLLSTRAFYDFYLFAAPRKRVSVAPPLSRGVCGWHIKVKKEGAWPRAKYKCVCTHFDGDGDGDGDGRISGISAQSIWGKC